MTKRRRRRDREDEADEPPDKVTVTVTPSNNAVRKRRRKNKSTSTQLLTWSNHNNTWELARPNQFPVNGAVNMNESLCCVSWNTFSGSNLHFYIRAIALLNTLQHLNAHIIALQEVSYNFESILRDSDWIKAEYVITNLNGFITAIAPKGNAQGVEQEGVMILCKRTMLGRGSRCEFIPLPSPSPATLSGKGLVLLKVVSNGVEKIRFMTSHFTSLPINRSIRQQQYTTAMHHLTPSPSPSLSLSTSSPHVLLADFNNSSHEELALPFASLVDTYSSSSSTSADLFRDDPTFGELYPYVIGGSRSRPRKPRRIDRILIGGVGIEIVENTRRIGREPITSRHGSSLKKDITSRDGMTYASDHCGIVAVLRIV